MKKYTLEWLLANPRLTRATRPKPFPGKYPTRIAFKAVLTDGKVVTYVGKPSLRITNRIRHWRTHYVLRSIQAMEFDRNGVLARDKTVNALRWEITYANLRQKYHPFLENNKFFNNDGLWRPVTGPNNKPYMVFWPFNQPVLQETVRAIERALVGI